MTVHENFYKNVLDNLFDGVYFVNPERQITYWNKGAEHISGFQAQEVLGKRCSEQLLMHADEEGNILGFEDRLLLNSISLSMREIHQKVSARGGITIAAHFDKASFSLMSQLGIIPLDMELEALEISRAARGAGRGSLEGRAASFPSIASSDAHEVREIGLGYTVFLLAAPTLDELRLAFRGQQGRRIVQTVIDGEKIS